MMTDEGSAGLADSSLSSREEALKGISPPSGLSSSLSNLSIAL